MSISTLVSDVKDIILTKIGETDFISRKYRPDSSNYTVRPGKLVYFLRSGMIRYLLPTYNLKILRLVGLKAIVIDEGGTRITASIECIDMNGLYCFADNPKLSKYGSLLRRRMGISISMNSHMQLHPEHGYITANIGNYYHVWMFEEGQAPPRIDPTLMHSKNPYLEDSFDEEEYYA